MIEKRKNDDPLVVAPMELDSPLAGAWKHYMIALAAIPSGILVGLIIGVPLNIFVIQPLNAASQIAADGLSGSPADVFAAVGQIFDRLPILPVFIAFTLTGLAVSAVRRSLK